GGVDHLFACAEGHPAYGGVGAVTTDGGPFDGGEIHVVAVAVAHENRLHVPGPFLQAPGMVTEEFAGATDESQLVVDEDGGEVGTNLVALHGRESGCAKLGKEGLRQQPLYDVVVHGNPRVVVEILV